MLAGDHEGGARESDAMLTVRLFPVSLFVGLCFVTVDGGSVVALVGPVNFRFDRDGLTITGIQFCGLLDQL